MSEARSGAASWMAFSGCCLIWGSTFLFISIGNDSVPPFWAAALRLALASLVLGAITKLAGHEFPRGPALKAAVHFGVFQMGLNMPLLYWGEKTVPSGLTAVLFATIPLSSAFFTRVLGMELLNPLKIVGGLVALAGVAAIGSSMKGGTAHLAGVLAVITAATLASLGTTLLKRGPRQSPFAANAVGCVVGLPFALLASLAAREPWRLPDTASAWFSIGYLVLMGSAGAFALMAWLIHRWPVTRVAFISVVTPVIALALGALVRHEPVNARSLAGSGLVFVGLACGMAADRNRAYAGR